MSKDYLAMSDEEFLGQAAPQASEAPQEDAGPGETPGPVVSEEAPETPITPIATIAQIGETPRTEQAPQAGEEPAAAGDENGDAGEPEAAEGAQRPESEPEGAAGEGGESTADAGSEAEPATQEEKEEAEKPLTPEEFQARVMAPFKANGKTFTPQSPDEVIRLMQMGAGYGRKLQELQPHLKTLRMLEKADLLDEGKLSFLIDLNQQNPEAIKKLIQNSGIDPLDLNVEDNVNYTPQNHAVSDEEMAFHNALEELQAHEGGAETIRQINQTWDRQSMSVLWSEPALLQVIQAQRDEGVYDQIVAEIDRQKILGKIAPNTPFLHAYKLAGDHLVATNGFKGKAQDGSTTHQTQTAGTPPPQPQVIATRVAPPKATVSNGTKAAAASSTPAVQAKPAKTLVNPLEMADDEFLKQFKNRL